MTVRRKGSKYSRYYFEAVGENSPKKTKKSSDRINQFSMVEMTRTGEIYGPFTDSFFTPDFIAAVSRPGILANNLIVGKVQEIVSDQQYLVDLMEAKSTIDLVNTQLKRVLKLARKLKRLPKEFPKRALRKRRVSKKPNKRRGGGPSMNTSGPSSSVDASGIPSAWLELNFAIKPTISAVNGLAETFNVPFDWQYLRYTTPPSDFVFKLRGYTDSDVSRFSGQVSLWWRLLNPNVGVIQKMGFTDYFSTIWELIPWSWAIDYFTNIGEMFANLDSVFKNVEFKGQRTTWRCNQSIEVDHGHFKGIHNFKQVVRSPGVNLSYKLVVDFGAGVRQLSYLSSAIALTLKGKQSK